MAEDEIAKTSSWLVKSGMIPIHVKNAVKSDPKPKKTSTNAIVINSATIRMMPRIAQMTLYDKTPIDRISTLYILPKIPFYFKLIYGERTPV